MTAPAPANTPEPVYTFTSICRGTCKGGCGMEYQPGDVVAKYRDEIRCAACAERWNK